METDGVKINSRPVTVEVLGPPGAGKTTLRAALCTCSEEIVPLSIYVTLRRLPLYLWSGLSLVPMFLDRGLLKQFPRKEHSWMIRLEASPSVLKREANGMPVVIFDQGPVFTMVRLRAAIPEAARGLSFKRWWDRMLELWAETLDLLILLDAPDNVLLRRIQQRPKAHTLKGYSEDKARESLAERRALREATIAELQAFRDVPMLRLDTGQGSLRDVVDQTMVALDLSGLETRRAELLLPGRSGFSARSGDG